MNWSKVGTIALGILAGTVVTLGTLAVAVAGFALSYDAVRAVGIAAHIRPGWAWLLPVSIDGAMAVATIAAVVLRRVTGQTAYYPWVVVLIGAAVSVACNGLHAIPEAAGHLELNGPTRFAVSAIPAVMLALSVHLLVELVDVATGPDRAPAAVPISGPIPAAPAMPPAPVRPLPATPPAAVPISGPVRVTPAAPPAAPAEPATPPANASEVAPDPTSDLPALARLVAAGLAREGVSLNRNSLATGMRARGVKISSDRATELVRHLRAGAAGTVASAVREPAGAAGIEHSRPDAGRDAAGSDRAAGPRAGLRPVAAGMAR